MDSQSLKQVIESLIFASETTITFGAICAVLEGEDKAEIKAALKELVDDYRQRSGGIFIEEVAGGYQFRTNPEASPWLKRLFKSGTQKLSRAAMESLAIIAYKQPVTRGELEAVRGVDSGGVLSTLMEKRLVKITGKKDVPGRPVVYGTTREFLETFDLKDLSCLPIIKDARAQEEEDGTNVRQALEKGEDAPKETSRVEDGLAEQGQGGEPSEGEAASKEVGFVETEGGPAYEEQDRGRAEPSEGEDAFKETACAEDGPADEDQGQGEERADKSGKP